MRIMPYECDFAQYIEDNSKKVVVYGAGETLEYKYATIPRVDYICDKSKEYFRNIKIIRLENLKNIEEDFCILFCIKKNGQKIIEELKSDLIELGIDVDIFDYDNNVAFDYYSRIATRYKKTGKEQIHINLACRNPSWIFGKFANKMIENCNDENIKITVSRNVDPDADLNHHIEFAGDIPCVGDTIMVSHVDCYNKLGIVKKQLETASLAICMSKDTMDKLTLWGIPRNKLCYINPAQDGIIKPRKYVLGITHKCYDSTDLKKRGSILVDICKRINPEDFRFEIMGDGWEHIISVMEEMGFEVNYQPFEYSNYVELMPRLDYFLYYGKDEGNMGFLDALAAGVKTIVTPQGFHLDIKNGITHECKTTNDFIDALHEIVAERNKRCNGVADLTWKNYTDKHIEIWNYLLRRKGLRELMKNQHNYEDGIFSMCLENIYQFEE